MARVRIRTACGFLLAPLVACATGYHPHNWLSGGYSDAELSPRIYEVGFAGNQHTLPVRVLDFVLLRAAELTLANGYRYFVLASGRDATDYGIRMPVVPDPDDPLTLMNPPWATFDTIPSSPGYAIRIELLHERPPDDALFVFDAAFAQRALRTKYELGAIESGARTPPGGISPEVDSAK